MIQLKFVIPNEAHSRLVYQLGTQYPNPLHALREYMTNAIDAIDKVRGTYPNMEGLVKVLLSPENRRVMIEDNAVGMSEAEMIRRPENIGLSAKLNRIDQRGEKGVGLLAFASVGHMVHIISRRKGEHNYSYLRYEKKSDSLDPKFDKLNESEVKRDFFGGFQQGTKVVIDVNSEILQKNFKFELVEKYIQETYLPLLMRKGTRFQIGTTQMGHLQKINAPSLEGISLISEELEFQANRSREDVTYNLFAHIVFNPDIDHGKVMVFSKDVKVYDSVIQLEDELADCELWKCRQILGFINEPHLKLTLGRDGINRNDRAYHGLVGLLQSIHKQHWPNIAARVKQSRAEKGSKIVHEAFEDLEKAYQITDPLNKAVRTRPEPGPDQDHNQTPEGWPDTPEPDPEPDPDHRPPKKPKRRRFPFGQSKIFHFGLGEEKLRSKLDTTMGEPVVAVNSSHGNYVDVVVQGKDTKKAKEYVFDVSTPVIAGWEAQKEIERGGSLGDAFEMAGHIARRAQDLKYATFRKRES